MAFNPDYLADAMESAKQFGPRVFAGLIDEFSPIVFQNGENWKCIIMPMPMS
jgi:DNA polymerase III sliding clamp (beta) subunit (PCNA family)